MHILLSTIGSRGDVQPLLALALELRSRGHEVRMCVPPDFREWIEGLGVGVAVTPIGPELKKITAGGGPAKPIVITPEVRRQMMEGTVAAQFETITRAAEGCEMIVGATALQVAAPTIAEKMRVPYVFAAYCPAVLPSVHHAPPPLGLIGQQPAGPAADHRALWEQQREDNNATWGPLINARRTALGLAPLSDVRSHILTAEPWLAADATLAPWPDPSDRAVFQPGAWILRDQRPLSKALETFLDAGEAPVYFGFGSMRAPGDLGRVMVEAARALGRRAIVSRGWAELALIDAAPDCVAIDEVNQQVLFRRVAAVVHHGGAGTTTAAAFAGAPQVIVPQMYDQHYFAARIERLGIGAAHPPGAPALESLANAIQGALHADVVTRARAVAGEMKSDGVRVAADRLLAA